MGARPRARLTPYITHGISDDMIEPTNDVRQVPARISPDSEQADDLANVLVHLADDTAHAARHGDRASAASRMIFIANRGKHHHEYNALALGGVIDLANSLLKAHVDLNDATRHTTEAKGRLATMLRMVDRTLNEFSGRAIAGREVDSPQDAIDRLSVAIQRALAAYR